MSDRMAVDKILIRDRHRKSLGDIDRLAASIGEVGLLHPPVVLPDGSLIAGERRLHAVKKLGWTEVPVTIATNLAEALPYLVAQSDENTCRLDFEMEEAVAIGEAIHRLREKPAAEERQKEAGKRGSEGGRGKKKNPSSKFDEGFCGDQDKPPATSTPKKDTNTGKSMRAVAAAVGMSEPTFRKAAEIVGAAKAEPDNEAVQKIKDEMNRTGKVNGAYKKLKTIKAAETIKAEPPPFPQGPFRVIIIDPPWSYDNRPDDPSHRASNPYPSMTIEQIKALPLAGMAHDDCILWLWTTNSHMPHAFEIAASWGFTHKTILTWVKDRFGTGDWLRGQTEHCLLCVRGKPVVTLHNQSTVIHGPLRAHSQKPEEFYALVTSLCPAPTNGICELFQRTPREGIVGHGNEITGR